MTDNKNIRLFRDAAKVIPGGVNSPVRAFKAVHASPIFIEKAKGPYLYDSAGKRYIDYCLSWGPLILGHAHKQVLDCVKKTIDKGTSFGVPTKLETQLARMLVNAVPSIEKVRLVNSGTEATMTAIRLARAFTGRDKIIKFIGCYHGHVDHLLVKAGSGAMTFGSPSSPGVPKDFTKHTILVPYNDIDALEKAFKKYNKKIAACIVEPVAANMGVVPPAEGFLQTIRNLCTKYHALLIFDEVITGFRLKYGSAQDIFNVKADLTCLGKIIGGGLPIGAVGGKAKIMDNLAPEGKVYQAGTLSGNPVCVAAGLSALKILKAQNPYPRLDRLTRNLCAQFSGILNKAGVEHTINRAGSMFTLFFTPGPVTDYASAAKSNTNRYARYFKHMLAHGIYLPPSQFEACFLSTAHTQALINKTSSALHSFSL
jgi:glutamate-1-semialdehyde 2,1-aminomutase